MPAHRPHPSRSLSARGQLLHTFAGLGFCLVFSLLASGSYIIEEEFRDPVAANSVGLLLASALIATAITLLYSFLHSSKNLGARTGAPAHRMRSQPRTLAVARTTAEMRIGNPGNLLLHARYVDQARVVIQR